MLIVNASLFSGTNSAKFGLLRPLFLNSVLFREFVALLSELPAECPFFPVIEEIKHRPNVAAINLFQCFVP